jgi:hypothetical protein
MANTTPPFDDIPPLVPFDQLPPIRTDLDLYRFWRMIMGPLGFGSRRLWLAWTDADGRLSPVLQQIEDVPRRASLDEAAALMQMLRHLPDLGGGGAVAIIYTRPGRAPMADDDRSWAGALTAAARDHDVAIWPIHFANDEVLQVFAPDDLVSRADTMPR